MTRPPITVWRFRDAPQAYQALSTCGGDEDWVALVPREWSDHADWIPWLNGPAFGCSSVDKFTLPDGAVIFIGAHA